jgi:hypothetical protein
MTKLLICYLITNIYAASSDQLIKQVEGERLIMDNVFDTVPDQIGKLCFEYGNVFKNDDSLIPNRQGILIGVNSCPFSNMIETMPIYNIHELMNFLAGNLNDEDFSKFVALTMNNRDFWDRISDGLHTRLQRASNTLSKWKIHTVSFFKWLFRFEKMASILLLKYNLSQNSFYFNFISVDLFFVSNTLFIMNFYINITLVIFSPKRSIIFFLLLVTMIISFI